MLQGYDARMESKPSRWWNKRLNRWQSVALYLGIVLSLSVVKAYFPEQTKAFTDTFGIPFIILLAIIFGWSLYQLWRRELSQPRNRR
jgi:TRAP-type C4-dicarboxylate transport system permease small subunit